MSMEVGKVVEGVEKTQSDGGTGEIAEITDEQVFLIPEDRKYASPCKKMLAARLLKAVGWGSLQRHF